MKIDEHGARGEIERHRHLAHARASATGKQKKGEGERQAQELHPQGKPSAPAIDVGRHLHQLQQIGRPPRSRRGRERRTRRRRSAASGRRTWSTMTRLRAPTYCAISVEPAMVKPMPIAIIRNQNGRDTDTRRDRGGAQPPHPERVHELVGDLQDVAAHDRKGRVGTASGGIGPLEQARVEGAPAEAASAGRIGGPGRADWSLSGDMTTFSAIAAGSLANRGSGYNPRRHL